MGAGGGGFFYLIANPKFHEKIKQSLNLLRYGFHLNLHLMEVKFYTIH